MNNTLGLGIFAALVYFQDLDWLYSAGMFNLQGVYTMPTTLFCFAEVTVILFVEFTIGIAVIVAGFGYKHTYIVCF